MLTLEQMTVPSVLDLPKEGYSKAYPLRKEMSKIVSVCRAEGRGPTLAESNRFEELDTKIRKTPMLRVSPGGQPHGELPGDTVLHGYAFMFGTWSEPYLQSDGTILEEMFKPGSLDEWFSESHNLKAYLNQEGEVIGCEQDGSLKVQLRDHGLYFQLRPYLNATGMKVIAGIRSGEIFGASPGWNNQTVRWEKQQSTAGNERYVRRSATKADLIEISLVGFSARPKSRHRWVKVKKSI